MIIECIRKELPSEALVFDNPSFDNSIVGISDDDRAIYDYDLMVEEFSKEDGCTLEESADFVSYNTIRSLSYQKGNVPIIMYKIEKAEGIENEKTNY